MYIYNSSVQFPFIYYASPCPSLPGSTDEKHVSTLPSEIDSVRWDRR